MYFVGATDENVVDWMEEGKMSWQNFAQSLFDKVVVNMTKKGVNIVLW